MTLIHRGISRLFMKLRMQPESLVPAINLHEHLPLRRFFCLRILVHESGIANRSQKTFEKKGFPQ